jgi:putative intracellular protease/amidase
MPGARLATVCRQGQPGPVQAPTAASILHADASLRHRSSALDLLFVPGGYGQIAQMEDAETLAFLRRVGARARWVTSACTGVAAPRRRRAAEAATAPRPTGCIMDLLPGLRRDRRSPSAS